MLVDVWEAAEPFPPEVRLEFLLLEALMDRNGRLWQASGWSAWITEDIRSLCPCVVLMLPESGSQQFGAN